MLLESEIAPELVFVVLMQREPHSCGLMQIFNIYLYLWNQILKQTEIVSDTAVLILLSFLIFA